MEWKLTKQRSLNGGNKRKPSGRTPSLSFEPSGQCSSPKPHRCSNHADADGIVHTPSGAIVSVRFLACDFRADMSNILMTGSPLLTTCKGQTGRTSRLGWTNSAGRLRRKVPPIIYKGKLEQAGCNHPICTSGFRTVTRCDAMTTIVGAGATCTGEYSAVHVSISPKKTHAHTLSSRVSACACARYSS